VRLATGVAQRKVTLLKILDHLEAMHANFGWHWSSDTAPFEVCVGAILVQNTAWANAERALVQLRSAGVMSPGAMGRIGRDRLAELIRPSGQYRQKTRKLHAFLELVANAGGLEGLLSLPKHTLRIRLIGTWGIGPETADCILLYAAGQDRFVIDAYTIRLFTRFGMGPGAAAGYPAWQHFFEEAFADESDGERQRLWARYHARVVVHCKRLCLKRRPRCIECTLKDQCPASVTEPAADPAFRSNLAG